MNNEERIKFFEKFGGNTFTSHPVTFSAKVIDAIEKELSSKDAEIQQLKDWKESAMSVFPDMQKIGQLIGVKLGHSVHDKIIPAIEAYQREIQQLKEDRGKVAGDNRFPLETVKAAARYGYKYAKESQGDEVPDGNIEQWLLWYIS